MIYPILDVFIAPLCVAALHVCPAQQVYVIPPPPLRSPSKAQEYKHIRAVYSMWQHLVYALSDDPSHTTLLNPYRCTNVFTETPRLPVFINLSKGIPVNTVTDYCAEKI